MKNSSTVIKSLMSRNACNGEKSPEGRRLKLDSRSGPLEGGDFSETGKIWQKLARNRYAPWRVAQMVKNRQRTPNVQNVANVQIECQKLPLQIR